ncbi:MAG: F0F1 ATP synthase subunit B [Sulfurovum sp.]|nr:F0F1 ATP synthase subunit B [Sulfurovum sp.]
MNKKLIVWSLIVLPAILLASGDAEATRYFAQTGRTTDFLPRAFNFIIFASLLYYLLANPIKNFFNDRKEGIASQLKEIEEKLQAAKDEKKEAQVRLKDSEQKATQIIDDARKEADLLAKKINDVNANDLKNIEKQLAEKISLAERKSVKDTIDEVLGENITKDDIILDENKVIDIISKKVA